MRQRGKPWDVRVRARTGRVRTRVVDDVELYHQIHANVSHMEKTVGQERLAAELGEMVRLTLEPWADWTVKEIATRARLFHACIRRELGRRFKLDPNQLRLMKGV